MAHTHSASSHAASPECWHLPVQPPRRVICVPVLSPAAPRDASPQTVHIPRLYLKSPPLLPHRSFRAAPVCGGCMCAGFPRGHASRAWHARKYSCKRPRTRECITIVHVNVRVQVGVRNVVPVRERARASGSSVRSREGLRKARAPGACRARADHRKPSFLGTPQLAGTRRLKLPPFPGDPTCRHHPGATGLISAQRYAEANPPSEAPVRRYFFFPDRGNNFALFFS